MTRLSIKELRLENDRLHGAVMVLSAALQRIIERPAMESAFIAAVNLQDVKKWYGVEPPVISRVEKDNHG